MSLTILTDNQVKYLLNSLTVDDVHSFQDSMRNALHGYATGATFSNNSMEDQPPRTVVGSKNGTTSLFMPSVTTNNMGVKGSAKFKYSIVHGLSNSNIVVTHNTSTSKQSHSSADSLQQNTAPQGALTLMTAEGKPYAFINSKELTAFRTALTSTLLVSRRTKVKVLTCFGCGRQAYWHIRLTLLLRGPSIKKVHFINREFSSRASQIMKDFMDFDPEVKKREGWYDTTFDLSSLKFGESEKVLKGYIRNADILFCATPSTAPLFNHAFLTNNEGRKRARLIIAVGSYLPSMIELPPEIIEQATRPQTASHSFQRRAEEGGVIVVDSLACLRETGELVETNVRADRTMELGELVMLEYKDQDQVLLNDYDDQVLPPQSTLDNSMLLPNNNRSYRKDSFDSCCSSNVASNNNGISSSNILSKLPSRKSSISLSKPPPSKICSCRPRRSSDNINVRGRKLSSSENTGPNIRSSSILSVRSKKASQLDLEDKMSRWLSSGNVVYKSMGMGLMDLVSGLDIVRLARERGVGTTV
ncbi:hypothetical protein BGT96224_2422, partial [Blumeria graminis f. sp. tritici 96224]